MSSDDKPTLVPDAGEDNKIEFRTIDANLKATEDGVVIENRAEKEKILLRKIDVRMMPLLCVLCESNAKSMPQSGRKINTGTKTY